MRRQLRRNGGLESSARELLKQDVDDGLQDGDNVSLATAFMPEVHGRWRDSGRRQIYARDPKLSTSSSSDPWQFELSPVPPPNASIA